MNTLLMMISLLHLPGKMSPDKIIYLSPEINIYPFIVDLVGLWDQHLPLLIESILWDKINSLKWLSLLKLLLTAMLEDLVMEETQWESTNTETNTEFLKKPAKITLPRTLLNFLVHLSKFAKTVTDLLSITKLFLTQLALLFKNSLCIILINTEK
jgi:hypothetical protein